MKKTLLTIVTALLVLSLNAQISVWDGTVEPWTHGAGTQSDPYLIENARQLAYLAEKTNELLYNNYAYNNMYTDTCFQLTVDLDLGGENGLIWKPIAQDGVSLQTRCFGGNFDGGNHVISNMALGDDSGRKYMGLFGHVKEGSIKNITIDGDEIRVPEFITYDVGGLGIIVGYGENATIEHCTNNVDITWEYANFEFGACFGGLFGWMLNSTISDCHNYGKITVPEVLSVYSSLNFGGICGVLYEGGINNCSNHGDIYVKNGDGNVAEQVVCGGIVGRMTGTMTNCFNISNMDMEVSVTPPSSIIASAGGIVGSTSIAEGNLSITNSYCVSEMTISGCEESAYIGGILGYANDNVQVSVDNCYYINTIEDNGYGLAKSEQEMKSQDFVELLNALSDVYAMDDIHVNQGYPIFTQYYSVDENEAYNGISVYPNPARNIVNIAFSDDIDCQSVEIYTIDGRLLQSKSSNFETVDISDLNSGVYILKVNMADGREFTERIVKE